MSYAFAPIVMDRVEARLRSVVGFILSGKESAVLPLLLLRDQRAIWGARVTARGCGDFIGGWPSCAGWAASDSDEGSERGKAERRPSEPDTNPHALMMVAYPPQHAR